MSRPVAAAAKRTVGGATSATRASGGPSTSVDFEVFGKVQGVFFRKYTKQTADRLGLVGWCENTPAGTVVGVAQGNSRAIAEMKTWLAETGSPKSKITEAKFANERTVAAVEFPDFSIKR